MVGNIIIHPLENQDMKRKKFRHNSSMYLSRCHGAGTCNSRYVVQISVQCISVIVWSGTLHGNSGFPGLNTGFKLDLVTVGKFCFHFTCSQVHGSVADYINVNPVCA